MTTYYSSRWGAHYRWFNGGWVTTTDYAILVVVAAIVRPWWGTLWLTQGGLSTGVRASAMTHAGLGGFDISVAGHSKAQVWRLCVVLLLCGFIPFPRGWVADSFQYHKHIHVVSQESYGSLHQQAKDQLHRYWFSYFNGGNGLAGIPWQRYAGPGNRPQRWYDSPYRQRPTPPPKPPPPPPPPKGILGMSKPIYSRRDTAWKVPARDWNDVPTDATNGYPTVTGETPAATVTATLRISGLADDEWVEAGWRCVEIVARGGKAVTVPRSGRLPMTVIGIKNRRQNKTITFNGPVPKNQRLRLAVRTNSATAVVDQVEVQGWKA
jgi:hypothetical protein